MHPEVVLAPDDAERAPASWKPEAGEARAASAEAAYEEPCDGQAAEDEDEPRDGSRVLELSEDDEGERDRREAEARHRQDSEEIRRQGRPLECPRDDERDERRREAGARSEERAGHEPRRRDAERGRRGAREKEEDQEAPRAPARLDLRPEAPDEKEVPEDRENRDVDDRVRHETPHLAQEERLREEREKRGGHGREQSQEVADADGKQNAACDGRDAAPAGRTRPTQPVRRSHRRQVTKIEREFF